MDSQRLLERIESGSRKFEEEFDGVKVQVDVESADQLGLLLNSIVVESGSAPENPAGALKRQTAKLVDDFGYIDDLKLIEVDAPAVAAQVRSSKPEPDGFTDVVLRGGKSVRFGRRGSPLHLSKKNFGRLADDLDALLRLR